MESDAESAVDATADNVCTFGDLKLQVGQQLYTAESDYECRCVIPPIITCKQDPIDVSITNQG